MRDHDRTRSAEGDASAATLDGLRLGLRVRRSFGWLALWRQRTQQRNALAELDARELRDIGLTSHDVRTECAKPFWKA